MKQDFEFKIYSLLTMEAKDKISGPMSPLLFAREIAAQMEFKYNRIARVTFSDVKLHQVYEGDSLTGHDTLIIGHQYNNDLWLSLWVDKGVGGMPVAACFQSDLELTITPIYAKATFARKLIDSKIMEIFKSIFNDSETIAIKMG